MESQAKNKRTRRAGLSKVYALATTLLVATAQAAAQDKSSVAGAPRNRRIFVSIPDRKLALVEDGRVLRVYTVAVGAPASPSPAGEFKVISRLSHPTYYHTGVVIPPGKDNPLGTRWIGLDRKSYGIHGTNQPQSIGKAASHGCIRLARADLEQLFDDVRVGDTVGIRAHADAETAAIFNTDRAITTAQVVVSATASKQM